MSTTPSLPNETHDTAANVLGHEEQMKGYLMYGAKAGLLAGVGATAALFTVQRYTVGLGTSVIAAENAVYRVRRPSSILEEQEKLAPRTMSEFIFQYRHPIVGGTFGAAVAVGALLSARDPYRSGTQKFLNIRLYGQALALGALFGTIGLGSIVAQHRRAEAEERERVAMERMKNLGNAGSPK